MQIPEKIKIGWREYTVEKGEKRFCQSGDLCGEIDYGAKVIYLYEGLDNEEMANTFLHEIIHGIFEYMGREQDEGLVVALTEGLYQVLRDNPDVRFN